MEVRFYAMLRDVVGGRTAEIDVDSAVTARDLLQRLFERYPGLESEMLDETGELRRAVNVFVNGRSIRHLEGLQTEVQPHDDVAMFPPVAGGKSTRGAEHATRHG